MSSAIMAVKNIVVRLLGTALLHPEVRHWQRRALGLLRDREHVRSRAIEGHFTFKRETCNPVVLINYAILTTGF